MADLSPAGSGLSTAQFDGRRLSEALLPLELAPRTQLQLAAISRWNALRGIRVGLVAAALLLLLVGANLATPIYPVLQQRLGLTALDTTILFTVYVFALVPVLAAAGHWSDHLGRRAMILPAVALAACGDALFAMAGSFWQLAAGRAVQASRSASPPAPPGPRWATCCPTARRWPPSSPWPARRAGWPSARSSGPRSPAASTRC